MPAQDTHLKFTCLLLPVRDLEMMAAFYRDVLGFAQSEGSDPTKASFDIGPATLCLFQAAAPMRDDLTVGPTLLFTVADVAAAREQLIEQGVHMGKFKSFGAHSECDGTDPEGNLFRLNQDISSSL